MNCGCCPYSCPDELAVTFESNACVMGLLCPLRKEPGPAWPMGDDGDESEEPEPRAPVAPVGSLS